MCPFNLMHTSYLSFILHWQDFRKPNFTPKKTTKGTKNTKNVSEKVKYMHFFHSIWKNLHLTDIFTQTCLWCLAASPKSCWIFANLLHPGRHIVVQESIHRVKCPCDILTQNPWNLLKYFPCNFQESWAGCIPRSMQSVIWMPPSMKIFEKPSKNIL